MSGFNLPPGCSMSDLPGNRPEDIDWENACEMATAVCNSAVPWMLDSMSQAWSEKLIEAMANALVTAHDNGKEAGISLGKADARMEAIENAS